MTEDDQPFLFDDMAARAARDQAIAQVEANASQSWLQAARDAVYFLTRTRRAGFTTDDVWRRLQSLGVPPPHERRALGPVMLKAAAEGWIIPTGAHQNSARVICHQNPKMIWRAR